MSEKEKEKPKDEEDEEGEKRKSKTALLAGIALGFCLILGGVWAIAFTMEKRQ